MRIIFTKKALKSYQKLPLSVKKKADKQFRFIVSNVHHPSLHMKKMEGEERWEARIDRLYRFTFEKKEGAFILRTVGSHDEGLGKR